MTFLPDDSPFSEYTDISGRAHAMAERGENHVPLTPEDDEVDERVGKSGWRKERVARCVVGGSASTAS